jgi:hypothetical protein
MPLVRIDVVEGRCTPAQLCVLADAVQKRALSSRPAQRLGEATGLSHSDLVISVATDPREDRSFGLGRAQFLDGDL